MSKKIKQRKTGVEKVTILFKVLSIIGIICWVVVYSINYAVGENENSIIDENGVDISVTKKDRLNILVCGVNEIMTDTIIYAKYNVKTGKVVIISIPRDTYVNNKYSTNQRINSIYRLKNIIPLIDQVEELLDVSIDYYIFLENSLIREVVDAIGGVEIDVERRMKYDDATQDLHIDIQKGLQTLTGEKAEHYIRFRQNNDGTGYVMGDIDRVEVQQKFIKELAKQILSAKNIAKIPDLIKIVLNNTKTNGTIRDALRYSSDLVNVKMDSFESYTVEGTTKDGDPKFYIDKEATQELIKEKFNF